MVIAIIAILASMLLPALNKAKAKGQTILCNSNLKQLGLAAMMYADENNEWLPSGHFSRNCAEQAQPQYQTGGWYEALRAPYIKSLDIFRCPSWENPRTVGPCTSPSVYCCYGVNDHTLGERFPEDIATYQAHRRPDFDLPTEGAMMMDAYTLINAADSPNGGNEVGGDELADPTKNGRVHNFGRNVVYLDGHAGWRSSTTISVSHNDPFWAGRSDGALNP